MRQAKKCPYIHIDVYCRCLNAELDSTNIILYNLVLLITNYKIISMIHCVYEQIWLLLLLPLLLVVWFCNFLEAVTFIAQ